MKSYQSVALVFFIIISTVTPTNAKKVTELTINPGVTAPDSTFTAVTTALPQTTFFIRTVTDESSARNNNGIVGETRVRRNKMLPIICRPVPSETIRNSLFSLFSDSKKAANDEQSADILIDIVIIDFTLTETSKKLTQTMDAAVTIKVTLSAAGTVNPHTFTVSTRNSYTTLDTSKHAEKTLRGALADALREILKNCAQPF